ncbi:hypothetical protein B0I37DRAFT_378034 [Chaetomium sp. MPI-CAGE-AT-0009]|nr:hypothetical protein B0I37DRAFT_378034 [Chaetomium sp. MPI-CAGE-AT-0009]
MFTLTDLLKRGTASRDELDGIWKRVGAMYRQHSGLLESRWSLYVNSPRTPGV